MISEHGIISHDFVLRLNFWKYYYNRIIKIVQCAVKSKTCTFFYWAESRLNSWELSKMVFFMLEPQGVQFWCYVKSLFPIFFFSDCYQGCILLTYLSVISSKFIQEFAQKCQCFTLIDQSIPLDKFYITFYLRTNQRWTEWTKKNFGSFLLVKKNMVV